MHRGHAQCHVLCVSASGHAVLWARGRRESQGSHTMDPVIDPLTALPIQLFHHTLTGVLEHLHIPVVQEVSTRAASRRQRGTVGGGPATIGVSRSWPASTGEPHGLGEESRL
jgi:hypothetical protein